MRKITGSLALVFVIAVFLSSVVLAVDEETHPSILIEEMRHDMGEVFEQKTYKHKFVIKNTGTADLEIQSVKPG